VSIEVNVPETVKALTAIRELTKDRDRPSLDRLAEINQIAQEALNKVRVGL
jgi:hypothetical protein